MNNLADMHTEPMNESPVALIELCVIPQNYVDPDIPSEQLLQQQNTAPQIPFPHIASSPVNTFQQEQLKEHAFPVLYPKGRFGLGIQEQRLLQT